MKNILGFDSWTGGAHNFARLVPALKEYGFDLQLLHIGSWGGDVGRPREEMIECLKVRDIMYYKGMGLLEILDIERPCVVIFLSNDVFAHRAFNRYCRLRGVLTLHLYHGLVEIQSTQGERMYKPNLINQMSYVLSRIPKAILKIWPLYMRALLKSGAKFDEWKRFFGDIINLSLGKYIPVAALDSRASACAVYTEADIEHAMKKYGYSKNSVHVVGNPDLSKFNLKKEMLGSAASGRRFVNDEIVYVDTGLIYAGIAFSGSEDYLSHLAMLSKKIESQGLSLAIKLHPDHYRTDFTEKIKKIGIRLISNEDFVPSLLKCRAAMVEPSTAALIPALLGLPLLMVAFGKLKNQKYGKVITDYPRSCLLTDVEMVLPSIENIENDSASSLDAWINRNAGPLPSEEMPRRVATVIAQLAEMRGGNIVA